MASGVFGQLGSPKYKEYADDIHASSDHLLNLINDILDLSAIEAGEHSLNKEWLSAKEMVDDCSPLIAVNVSDNDIQFSVDAPADLKPFYADRRAIKQILINLLDNAVKFTPAAGSIKIRVYISHDHHYFEILDTGVGIPEDMLSTITDSFIRVETNPYKAQQGTGLGLAIVKSLVEMHDGRLEITSTLGVGTKIVVIFPSGTRPSVS
jgi:two-component system cell cycle sensor histidine kinase PleC